MRREITITTDPIDESALRAGRSLTTGVGAVVYFLGMVRDREDGQPIQALEYECFREMALHQFNLLFDQVGGEVTSRSASGKIESIRLVHRVGEVPVNEPSLWVEVTAPHRQEAFAACQWLIDEMKRVVPIWKKPIGK